MFRKLVILVIAALWFSVGYIAGIRSATAERVQEMDISTRVERISYIPTHLRTDAEMAFCRTYQEQLLK